LGVSVVSAFGLGFEAGSAELGFTRAGLVEDGITSMVDSSDLAGGIFERPVDSSIGCSAGCFDVCSVGTSAAVCGDFSECRGLFSYADTVATVDGWLFGSFTGCEARVLDLGINAEAKADFSFDLSNIPDAILGR